MQKGLYSSSLFWSQFACAQTAIFFAELCSKNAGETSIVHWVAACIHHSAIQTIIEVHFGGFYHPMKVRQPIARLCRPWSEQAGGWSHFCVKQLRTLKSFQIFKVKKKIKKHLAVDVLLKGFPMTLMQIQSGQTVPLKIGVVPVCFDLSWLILA